MLTQETESAFDPNQPYFDPKSSRDKPKWFNSHVAFRQKFDHPENITLTALREYAKPGGPLEGMQLFKQTRLSVIKVSKKEWDFILGLANGEVIDEPEDVTEMSESLAEAIEDTIDETVETIMEEVAEELDATSGAEIYEEIAEQITDQIIDNIHEIADEIAETLEQTANDTEEIAGTDHAANGIQGVTGEITKTPKSTTKRSQPDVMRE